MTRWLLFSLMGAGCFGSNDTPSPVDLGGECQHTEECRSGLACEGGSCAGSRAVRARVVWLQSEVPDDTLYVGVLTEADRALVGSSLDPATVRFTETVSAPVYPVELDITGLEIGRYYLVAYIPLSEADYQIAAFGDQFVELQGLGLVLDQRGEEIEQPVGIGVVGQVDLP